MFLIRMLCTGMANAPHLENSEITLMHELRHFPHCSVPELKDLLCVGVDNCNSIRGYDWRFVMSSRGWKILLFGS